MEELVVFGLVVAGAIFFTTSILSWRWAAFFILLLSFLDLHLMLPLLVQIEPGISIHGTDVFFVSIFAATLIRLISMRRVDGVLSLWLALSAGLFIAFIHGALSFGFQTAAASYRATFYLTAGATYFALFPYNSRNIFRAMDLVIILGMILVLSLVVIWLVPEWQPMETSQFASSKLIYERNRALPAQAAQFLALAAITSLPFWLQPNGNLARRAFTIPLLAAAIFLFHRTVWVMLAVSILTTLATSGRQAIRTFLVIQVLLVILALFWLLLVGLDLDVLSDSVRTAVIEAADSNNSTFDWRVQGWRILVGRAISEGPITILFGAGFGLGFERTISQEYVNFSPHNYYVELFLTSGLLGCGLFLAATIGILRRTLREALHGNAMEMLAMPGIILGLMVYSASYSPQYDCALLLGIAIAYSAAPRRVPFAPGAGAPIRP